MKLKITLAEAVDLVHASYPEKNRDGKYVRFNGFDRTSVSKGRYPDYSGLIYHPDVQRAIRGRLPAERRRKRFGELVDTLSWRVTKDRRTRLQTAKERLGLGSLQEALDIAVEEWLERVER